MKTKMYAWTLTVLLVLLCAAGCTSKADTKATISTTAAIETTQAAPTVTVLVSAKYLLPADAAESDLSKIADERGWKSLTENDYDFLKAEMTEEQKRAFTAEYEQWMTESLCDPENYPHVTAVLPIRSIDTEAVTTFFLWTDLEPDENGQLSEQVGGTVGANPIHLYAGLKQ